jgi:protein Tex
VGVDLNTASASLLGFVSGIGPALAQNIVETRKKALFQNRAELLKVPKFSAKVFEQSAGFLRVSGSKIFLDTTGIHPERYTAVRDMAGELGVPITELVGDGAKKLLSLRTKWTALIGEYTFDDIIKELEKPGRDPRDPFKVFNFRDDIFEVKDLKENMICPGIVTNVTNFGAFVDIGVHQDGLVHISELSNKFVDDPRKVVNPGDQVTVKVIGVDLEKNQVALTMRMESAAERRPEPRAPAERQPRPQQGARSGNGERSQQRASSHRDGARENQRPQQGRRDSRRDDRGGNAPQRGGGGPAPRPAGKPFNNPFAALLEANNKKS